MKRIKIISALLLAAIVVASLCSCGSKTDPTDNSNAALYGNFHKTEPVGTVPGKFKKIVTQNLFYNAEAFEDKLLKCYEGNVDESGYITSYVIESLGFDGKTLSKVTLETGYGHHIRGLTATSDGGFIFTEAFSDYNDNGQWLSANGFSSYVVKYDQSGNMKWKTKFENVEGWALRKIVEADGYFYVFGDRQTPETNVTGIGSPTDIMIVKLGGSGALVNTRLIGGSSFDSIYDDTVRYESGKFKFRATSQSDDGDFEGKGADKFHPKPFIITVDADLGSVAIEKTDSDHNFRDYQYVGILSGKKIYASDEMFKNFADGDVTALIDYGDSYLVVSENKTGIYENTPLYISSIWYNTETVYAMYDRSGKLIWKDAVKSSNYENLVLALDDQTGKTAADVAGTYARQNEGFGGIDKFTITLTEDGKYQYYETVISSFIGMGDYTVDGDTVTIVAEMPGVNGTITHTFKFKADGKTLVYVADGSDNFTYIKLPDGAVFERMNETE